MHISLHFLDASGTNKLDENKINFITDYLYPWIFKFFLIKTQFLFVFLELFSLRIISDNEKCHLTL